MKKNYYFEQKLHSCLKVVHILHTGNNKCTAMGKYCKVAHIIASEKRQTPLNRCNAKSEAKTTALIKCA